MVSGSVDTEPKSTLDDPITSGYLNDLHDQFVIVPAGGAPSGVMFICKAFYYSCLLEDLDGSGRGGAGGACRRAGLSGSGVLIGHRSVLSSLGVGAGGGGVGLPSYQGVGF